MIASKHRKKNNWQSRIVYSKKLSFKNQGKIIFLFVQS